MSRENRKEGDWVTDDLPGGGKISHEHHDEPVLTPDEVLSVEKVQAVQALEQAAQAAFRRWQFEQSPVAGKLSGAVAKVNNAAAGQVQAVLDDELAKLSA